MTTAQDTTAAISIIPKLPAAALTVTPIVVLTAIAATLAAAGVASFRRRNLALPT